PTSSSQSPIPWQFVYDEDLDRVTVEITPLINGLVSSKSVQNRNYTKDGRVIICQWYSSAVFDTAGNLISVLSFAQDITDRQQAEWELRQQKELRETIFNESTDAIFLVDPQTLLIFDCNRRAVELFEVESKTELIGKEGRTFQRHPFTSKEIDEITQQMQQKGFWSAELEYISRQRNSFWANIAAKPVKIANQWINLIRLTDISEQQAALRERKRMEAALRESEERFRRAFDDAAIGMALVALDGRFLQVNIALCEITGYSEAELLGNFFQDITHPDDLEKDLEYIRQVLAGKCRTYQMEKRYIHKSGHLVWGLLSVSVVKDQQGNCLYFVTQIQDISERHKIDRIKDEFISIVSHELRTPLTAIRGSLGILESGVLDNRPEKAQYMLQVAVKNSDRLVRLVNDILDLERLESGKVKLVMGKCQVEDLMQQAIESVQAIAHQAQIKLELTPLVAEIWASSDTIIQALTNLLSNAIKFSPAHSTIWLSAERKNSEPPSQENPNVNLQAIPELPPTSYIVFQVRDQGRGIPAEKLETIFGRFQQVDLSDSRQKGGTGLGLAICKSIVQQHGGKIWVESALGQGSTFYFTLPIKSKEV
ncbi:PAS domain S-box protein, partial [Phormidium sp. LEGE 05292]|uniref:PAS domain S-box protein n=1 Tax=[Phormidium] sp. LEGE 05292 TaxID=767427 RepID=UPI00187FB12D